MDQYDLHAKYPFSPRFSKQQDAGGNDHTRFHKGKKIAREQEGKKNPRPKAGSGNPDDLSQTNLTHGFDLPYGFMTSICRRFAICEVPGKIRDVRRNAGANRKYPPPGAHIIV